MGRSPCQKNRLLVLKIQTLRWLISFLLKEMYFIDYAIIVVPLSPLYSPLVCMSPPTWFLPPQPRPLVHVHGLYV